jgi:hypothetical protein
MARKLSTVIGLLLLLALAAGCLQFAPKPPSPPGVDVQGAIFSTAGSKDIQLRAFTPAVTATFDNSASASPQDVAVTLSNVRAEAIAVSGLTPLARQTLSPTSVKFLFRLPPGQATTASFTTPGGDSFAFAVIGDNRDGREVYLTLLDKLNAAAPAFVINGGDLVPAGTRTEYDQFLQDSARLAVPYYTVLGNHDIKGDGRQLYNRLLAPNYYDFVWGNSQFLVLDDADGYIDDAQLAWLQAKLQNRAARHVFLILHRPLFDPRPGQRHTIASEALADKLAALAATYRVTAVFASHIHMYWQGERQGIPYYVTGGAGAPLYAPRAAGGVYHYVWVRVDGDAVTAAPVEIATK